MNGDDLTGFNDNLLYLEVPNEFPCPKDALWFTWDNGLEVKRDLDGNVVSMKRKIGK